VPPHTCGRHAKRLRPAPACNIPCTAAGQKSVGLVRQVRLVRPHRLRRHHRAEGPAVPDPRWSESRAILPYGRNHKATKWRGGSEPPLAALSPLGERLPHWGTDLAGARRPCCALSYGRRSFGSCRVPRSSGTCPCRQDHWVQNGCGRIMYSRTMGRIRMGPGTTWCATRCETRWGTCPGTRDFGAAKRVASKSPHDRTSGP
jgi:hypothetical protein